MEIKINNEELVKQSLFDKEKIKSICDRYVDKIIPFDKQCFKCFIKRNKRYFFNFNEGSVYWLIKEILFWWMLIDNILLCVSKKWRQHTIDMLSHDK